MLIKSLKLNNFRSYDSLNMSFNPGLNIITGVNGIGKTNILESFIFVSNTKSFRTLEDKNLIKENTEYARIIINSDEGEFKAVINSKGKSLFLNNSVYRRSSDYIGKLNCILFKPSDLELFNQSPKERRKLLDIEIGKVSNNYLQSLLKYNSLLKDKNKILKEDVIDENLLDIYEAGMIPEMKIIIQERDAFFEEINKIISGIYRNISGESRDLKIRYYRCSEIEELENNLLKNKEKDRIYRYSTFGTHHEDYSFFMDDKEINKAASQGQRRMALISFKLALVEYIRLRTGKTPVILLDDVLSELDRNNRERLLKQLPEGCQVFITDTGIENLNVDRDYKLIELKEN